MKPKKLFKTIFIICSALFITLAGLVLFNWKTISDAYWMSKGGKILYTAATAGENVYKIYRRSPPNVSIQALIKHEALLLKLIEESKKFPPEFQLSSNEKTLCGDLGLTYGRLALKYKEEGNFELYEQVLAKSVKYLNKWNGSITTQKEALQLINNVDKNNTI